MAHFSIICHNANTDGMLVPYVRDEFIGAKQTRSWVKKTYGANSREYLDNEEFYYVRQRNRFDIIWVHKYNGQYHICVGGHGEKIPFNTDYVVSKIS